MGHPALKLIRNKLNRVNVQGSTEFDLNKS